MKRFVGIAKVGPDKFVKYNFNNPHKFKTWIISKYDDFRYCNVYFKESKAQAASFVRSGAFIWHIQTPLLYS